MIAEYPASRTCPICQSDFNSAYYKAVDGFLCKYYIHEDLSECEEPLAEMYFPKPYGGRILVDHQYVDYQLLNIFAAFCDDPERVEEADLKGIGDVYFPEEDLVVEIKIVKDLEQSVFNGQAKKEVFKATGEHAHYILNVIGSTVAYVQSTEEYATADFLTRVKVIEGALAAIASRYNVENTREFENFFVMCLFSVFYAQGLQEAKKHPKEYFIQPIDVSENEKSTVSAYRSINGFDLSMAKVLYDNCGSIDNLVRNRHNLPPMKGIGPIRMKNIQYWLDDMEPPKRPKKVE